MNLKDRSILRELATKVVNIAELPIMEERREIWKKHNRLEKVSPRILVFPEGSWDEILPPSVLQCEEKEAREIEWELKRRIHQHEKINDDFVIEKTYKVHKIFDNMTFEGQFEFKKWGLEPKYIEKTETNGSFGFDPVLKTYSDIKKLRVPELIYIEKETLKKFEYIQDAIGDILNVELIGISLVSFHLMKQYTEVRGLEQMMYDLLDEPNMVHEVMSFFEEGYQKIIKQALDENLFSINNDDTYQSSGGVGYSTELPKPGFNPKKIRTCDIWASAESQEMSHISPAMHEEFATHYERRLLSQFGLTGYGCCDPLTHKLDNVFKIPNLRRISISPWADVDICADKLKGNYIYSWKPNPIYLSGPDFNPDTIREYVKHTLDVTKDCVLEMILADTPTCYNQPERFTQWVKIMRELIEEN